MPQPKFSESQTGVFFDNTRGIHIGAAVQELAKDAGWDEEVLPVDDPDYLEAWQEAEDFLNEHAPIGYYFGMTENGDFGLWPLEDDE